MIESVEHRGKFLHECPLRGETRGDGDIFPAHPNALQLSRDRFLILYSTRSYRGRDDERSAVYQLRADGWDGRVLANGFISRTRDDWNPLGDGKGYVKQHGHPVAFGVPKGAMLGGRRVPHENVFVVMWRICARWIDPVTGLMVWDEEHPELTRATRGAEWLQFRLNDAEDDIEVIEPAQPMRQLGYEAGPRICEQPISFMIKGYVPATPLSEDCSQWVDMNTVDDPDREGSRGAVMAARYRFDERSGRYQWVQSARPIGPNLFEGGIVRWNGQYVGSARKLVGATGMKPGSADLSVVNWWRTSDPFGDEQPALVEPPEQTNWHPTTIALGADGGIKRLGGSPAISPYKGGRDPAYIFSIDPDRNFAVEDHHVVLDSRQADLPFEGSAYVDFLKLLPHTGGCEQVILHRVSSPHTLDSQRLAKGGRAATTEEMDASGIYWAKVRYSQSYPSFWEFDR